MEEIQLIRRFRSDVAAWEGDVRAAARGALLARAQDTSARRRPQRLLSIPRKRRFAVLAASVALVAMTAASAFALYGSHFDPDLLTPSEESFEAQLTRTLNGKVWTVGSTTNASGQRCIELRAPAGWRSGSCPPAAALSARAIVPTYGEVGSVAIMYGFAAPEVERLALIRADCSVETLPVSDDGLFMAVDEASVASPWKLQAFNQADKSIATRVLEGAGTGRPTLPC